MLAQKVSATIDRHRMFARDERLLAGISGGPDSVALAHVLLELGLDIVLAHLDHGLREDSPDDEAFCRRLASGLGVPYVTERVDVAREARARRWSLEDAGRRARYAFFRREAGRLDCGRIAVGHTMDDQAETVLMRLVRGSGTAGLSGVHPARGTVVRPLIEVRRRDIEAYLRERGLDFRSDPSNRDRRFARNRTRHELLPALERGFNPRMTETLSRTAELLREDEAWMESMAGEAAAQLLRRDEDGAGLSLSIRELGERHRGLARRVVRRALSLARGTVDDIGQRHVEDVLELAFAAKSGKELHLPGVVVVCSFDELRFCPGSGRDRRRDTKRGYNGFEYRLPIPAELRIPESAGTLIASPFGLVTSGRVRGDEPTASGDRVLVGLEGRHTELSVRSPRRGDRFRPLGAPGSKPLSRYLMERKVSREHRQSVPVVVRPKADAAEGEILWVVGHAISETARTTPSGEALELRWVHE